MDTESFMAIDYVVNKLDIQVKAEPLSADLDTIITDIGTIDNTP